ncbi:MAG: carboxypeptidase regulatory-like domain-containing protein [Candidatus Hydrogenedentes bacterium]|nr:carboxypeptidase regulatory-like domain-containing protein [Candidatus Hydrogenedentota bacterium]
MRRVRVKTTIGVIATVSIIFAFLLLRDHVLAIKVVDEEGKPIQGARISGEWSTRDRWEGPRRRGSFKGETDKDGRFSQSTPSRITVEINASGYYPYLNTWRTGTVPWQTVTIVLEKATQAVPTFELRVRKSWWKQWFDEAAFGVAIVPAPIGELVFQRDEADLWIEVKSSEAYGASANTNTDIALPLGKRQWEMSIHGENGWELAPGPADGAGLIDEVAMRVAPTSGYVPHLHFDSPKFISFYVRHLESGRYGKIYHAEFFDGSYPGLGSYDFSIQGLIQLENVGTTSLNPMQGLERLEWESKRALTQPEQSSLTN